MKGADGILLTSYVMVGLISLVLIGSIFNNLHPFLSV
jgi:hypothetical protein